MTSTLSYNKEQLLNYYRASCPEIQEPPENLKQFPLILSTKLLQPVNETNLHLFDSDYVSCYYYSCSNYYCYYLYQNTTF